MHERKYFISLGREIWFGGIFWIFAREKLLARVLNQDIYYFRKFQNFEICLTIIKKAFVRIFEIISGTIDEVNFYTFGNFKFAAQISY